MKVLHTKLTSQGQVSVPAEIRRRLGLAAGSVLEWDAVGDRVVIRRARRYSSVEVHAALFPDAAPKAQTLDALKQGVRRHIARRHARG